MAIAYLQEFEIQNGDTSTTNYDAVVAAINLQDAPDGLLIHTAGFDHDAGVFRIFDVWETREQGERVHSTTASTPSSSRWPPQPPKTPTATSHHPTAKPWYELHDSMTG